MGREKIRVLAALLAFMLPLLAACFALSRVHERITEPARFAIPAGTRVLILGDSHAVCSLDPARIGPAVNFSSNGENYVHNYYKLRYALGVAPSLRTVILPIDLHSFSDFRSDRVQVNPEWRRYIDYLEYGRQRRRQLHFAGELFMLRCFGFRGRYASFLPRRAAPRGASVSRLDLGFQPKPGSFGGKNSWKGAARRAMRQLEGVDHFSPEMELYFRKILELARRHRLHVVLLRFPVTPEYLKIARGLMAIEPYYARIRAIAREYPRTRALDRQRLFRRAPELFFRDAQHLNAVGARMFSDLIGRDLATLGLAD